MLQFQQQRIKRSLVHSQKVSADLLDAPGNSPAVLRSQDLERFEHHQRECSLQYVRLFLHPESTFRFPTGIVPRFPFGKQQEIFTPFCPKTRKAAGSGIPLVWKAEPASWKKEIPIGPGRM